MADKTLSSQSKHKAHSLKSKLLGGIVLAFFVSIMSLIGSLFDYLPHAPDEFMHDWRVTKFSTKVTSQRKDIALIYIDDDSLSTYPYKVPINRTLLASLVSEIDAARPRAIGIDIIFDRATEQPDDEALIEVLQRALSPIVLVGTDRQESGVSVKAISWQSQFLEKTKRSIADPFFDIEDNTLNLGSDVIRRISNFQDNHSDRLPFAAALAKYAVDHKYPSGQLIDWLLPASSGVEIFQTFVVPPHQKLTGGVSRPQIFPEVLKSNLKDKIVIVSGSMAGIDWHRVPMTLASNEEVSGAYIHAQILAQILDGREIKEVSPYIMMIVVFMTSLCLYLAIETTSERHPEIVFEFVIIGIAILLGTLMFWRYKVSFPTSHLMLAWLGIALLAKYTSQSTARWQKKMNRKKEG
jgi:adenylate cyclase